EPIPQGEIQRTLRGAILQPGPRFFPGSSDIIHRANRECAQPPAERVKIPDDVSRRGAVVRVWGSFSPSRNAIVVQAENDIVERYGALTRDAKCAARMQWVDGRFYFHVKIRQ